MAVTWDGGRRMEISFERIARIRFGGAPRWGDRDAWFFTIRFGMLEGDSRFSASAHDRDGLALRALMREAAGILLRDHPSVRVETGATWLAASVPAAAAALVTLALSALSVGFLRDGTIAAGVIMGCGAIAAGFYSRFFFRLLPRRVSDAATVAEHLRLSGEPRAAG
ncbi:MAG: hypothetical protein KIT43_10125 [Bauldia sp.]|nr:hypothetical protein [Bauldia sp.]MCW5718819.1 hypothetical protein [Bauldia sp.]